MENLLNTSLKKLLRYSEEQNFLGYDPYDILNSKINFKVFGKWAPVIAIQISKRNPVNIRPILGIKKEYNPKGLGLLLNAYSVLYKKTGEARYLEKADFLFEWLKNNYSKGYSGYAWGYNFDWASPGSYHTKYIPSVVVTSFVVDGIFEYYRATDKKEAGEIISSAARYINIDIPVIELEEGISFSYTHLSKGCCYNASLLAAEVLAKTDFIEGTNTNRELIEKAVKFVLSRQKSDGSWYYSYDPKKKTERKQIDFHQGFILVSLYNIRNLSDVLKDEINKALYRGLDFYKNNQFSPDGRSLWRLPNIWPVDIHNQSQGIITFSKLNEFNPEYKDFASTIARWTINNMQSKKGYFYYKKNCFFTNKISYMRWNQAWMMLALADLVNTNE